MRVALAVAGLLCGCATIAGIDDWPPRESGATGSGGFGADGGTGAAFGYGGGGRGGSAAGAAGGEPGGAGGAGGGCSGPITCWWVPGAAQQGSAPCNPGSPSGLCVPTFWDFCGCGGDGMAPAVFEVDPEGHPSAVTLVADAAKAPFNLGINGGDCVDAPEASCDSACPNEVRLYRWTDFGAVAPADIHSLEIWSVDGGSPCWGADGGTVDFEITGL